MQRSSRTRGGELGEIFFLIFLGAVIFWLYYRVYIIGPESILPAEWRNPRGR
jgi:bacteriorhodopsin